MLLKHLPKQKGGRLQHVVTFKNACHLQGDAEWIMDTTIQAHDEAVEEEFSHVGLTTLANKDFVVKLMEMGRMATQEVAVQNWFALHPHQNIVQGICHISCKDNPIRWKSRIARPQPLCTVETESPSPMIVIVQEYIQRGDLTKVISWDRPMWKSVVLQLTYACMEWYEQGFLYGDWHFGNILLDETNLKVHSFKALGQNFKVRTQGICPVITDFARSTLRPPGSLEIWALSNQISMIWDIFTRTCPYSEDIKTHLKTLAINMGDAEDAASIITLVQTLVQTLVRRLRHL